MKKLIVAILVFTASGLAHNSYTAGYSSAPGTLICASSCHGGTGGTLTVSGFPTSYIPGHTYTIVVKHIGGSLIVNYNATTRIGSSSTVAGTFAIVTNSALYGGSDGGVYCSPHSVDSSVFQWTAPAKGAGTVTLYAAGFQGTTSSGNGQSSHLSISSVEITTDVAAPGADHQTFSLSQNYPNPFNPGTKIRYELPVSMQVNLTVYDCAGREVSVLVNQRQEAGAFEVTFNGSNLASGVYVYRLRAGDYISSKKLMLLH
jgi:hypothetical protein